MTEQPLALRLADYLDATPRTGIAYSAKVQAAAELRRLHAENEALRANVAWAVQELEQLDEATAQMVALTLRAAPAPVGENP
jgi:hypothetical protein